MTDSKTVSFRRMAMAVARASKVPVDRILGRSRKHADMLPRHALIRLARNRGRSLRWIGKVLDRDHSTVLASCQRSAEWIAAGDPRGVRIASIESAATAVIAGSYVAPMPLAMQPRHGFVTEDGSIICDPWRTSSAIQH